MAAMRSEEVGESKLALALWPEMAAKQWSSDMRSRGVMMSRCTDAMC